MNYPREILKAPFGADSRNLLIDQYFAGRHIDPSNAWEHIFRLLLWIDPTTGLAHCYESDKSQPGKNWYGRSLAFHQWLAARFGSHPRQLHHEIDYLFRRATEVLAVANAENAERVMQRASAIRSKYPAELPDGPGNPELMDRVARILEAEYGQAPGEDVLRAIVDLVASDVRSENRRRNLIGEGFEDVLGQVFQRCDSDGETRIFARRYLHEVPGFREPRQGEKARKVDLAVVRGGVRWLFTVKWSIRADREEQFEKDYTTYVRLEEWNERFNFVLITNEFDPARLVSACKRMHHNNPMFDNVVHVQPEALSHIHREGSGNAPELLRQISIGRLEGVGSFVQGLHADR